MNAAFWKKYLCTSRVYSSLVFIPLFVLVLATAPKWLLALMVFAALLLALREAFSLLLPALPRRQLVVYGAAAGATWVACRGSLAGLVAVLFLAFIFLVLDLFRTPVAENAFVLFGRRLLLLFYLPFLFSHLLLLWDLDGGRALVAMVFLVAWGGDAFAYYTGRAWGQHKLAPAISPNKTVEGSIGGVVGAGIFALLLAGTGLVPLSWQSLVLLGMLANVAGQLGDLFESYLKRLGGSKDSGCLIPGHGGLLDRLDSILFAGPLLYYGALLLQR